MTPITRAETRRRQDTVSNCYGRGGNDGTATGLRARLAYHVRIVVPLANAP